MGRKSNRKKLNKQKQNNQNKTKINNQTTKEKPNKTDKNKKQPSKFKRAIFHPVSKTIVGVGLLCASSYGGYHYGVESTFDELKENITNDVSFMIGDKKYNEADVSTVLMQSDKDNYFKYVVTETMRYKLKQENEDFEVTSDDVLHVAKRDAETFKALGMSPEMFDSHILAQYGSVESYQENIRRQIIRAEYAKKHGDIESVAEDLYKDAKGHHAYKVNIQVGDGEKKELELTTYEALNQFGKSFLEELDGKKEGDTVTHATDYAELKVEIVEDLGEVNYKAFKDEFLQDVVRLNADDIQKPLFISVAKYIDKHRDEVQFNSAFEVNVFLEGLNEIDN